MTNAVNCIQQISRQWTYAASIKSGSANSASLNSFPWPPPKAKSYSSTDSAFLLLDITRVSDQQANLKQAHGCNPAGPGLLIISTKQLQVPGWTTLCGLEKEVTRRQEQCNMLGINTVLLLLLYTFGISRKWWYLDTEAIICRCSM